MIHLFGLSEKALNVFKVLKTEGVMSLQCSSTLVPITKMLFSLLVWLELLCGSLLGFFSRLLLAVLKCFGSSIPCHTRKCGSLSLLCLPPPKLLTSGYWVSRGKKKKIDNELERVAFTFFCSETSFTVSAVFNVFVTPVWMAGSPEHIWCAEAQKTSCLGVLCPAMLP